METSTPKLTWEAITLKLRTPFRISYGVSETRQAYWLRLVGDAGWGEGTIPPYYQIDDADTIAFWQAVSQRSDPFPNDPADIPSWIGEGGTAPARAALDLALHDRIARQNNRPLYEILDLPRPMPVATSYTIPIESPEKMAEMAASVPQYPILKIKLGGENDLACIAAIRTARPDARLYVDANAGWTVEQAVQQVQALSEFGLEMVEQPLPKDDIEGMGYVQAHVDVPLVADESVQIIGDVERLAAAGVQGINLKLMKIGGLAPAIRMIRRARQLGLRIMLGCMVETSLGVTAMANLIGLADWIDLDSPLMITNDPFAGVRYEGPILHLPERPGIGVIRRDEG